MADAASRPSTEYQPSAALLAANRRLHALRAAHRAEQGQEEQTGSASPAATSPAGLAPDLDSSRSLSQARERLASLPEHLGWGSAALAAVLRREVEEPASAKEIAAHLADEAGASEAPLSGEAGTSQTAETASNVAARERQRPDWVKHYPDIGLAMLRREQETVGRLWLLLRYLDREGSGQLRIVNIKQTLTNKSSSLHLCGKRQLRNLLGAGEGIFWTRNAGRIWLRSATKVAAALGVERLSGRPVALPVAALLDGIGATRAHLYAAFHSGRTKKTPQGEQAMPIARETLVELSGVGASSQRAYEEEAGVEVQANVAVGEEATAANQEERSWQGGTAVFTLKDYRGRQGKKGKTYLAWQLPNSYIGPHAHRPKGRQRQINRELKDLVIKGTPGNIGEAVGTSLPEPRPERVYYPTGSLAAKACNRNPEEERYWRQHRTRTGQYELWQTIGG